MYVSLEWTEEGKPQRKLIPKDADEVDLYNIPVDDLSPLGELSNLRYLRFSSGGIEELDLTSLSKCKKLESIDISDSDLKRVKLPSSHSSLKSITMESYFGVTAMELLDLSPLANYPKLEGLGISIVDTDLLDLEPVGECHNLKSLSVAIYSSNYNQDYTGLIDISSLHRCTKLTELRTESHHFEPADLLILQRFPQLQSLSISAQNELDFTPVRKCSNLTSFSFNGVSTWGHNLEYLAFNKNLQSADIRITGSEKIDIGPLFTCPSLYSLTISTDLGEEKGLYANQKLKKYGDIPEPIKELMGGALGRGKKITWDEYAWDPDYDSLPMFDELPLPPIDPPPIYSPEETIEKKVESLSWEPDHEIKESPSNIIKDEVSPSVFQKMDDEVRLTRGYELVGGRFEYKVKIENLSKYVITDVAVTIVAFPETCTVLDEGRLRSVSKIEPDGFRSLLFTFRPTQDCVKGSILTSVSYVDYTGAARTLNVESQNIRSVCDLLVPLEATLDEFLEIIKNLDENVEERDIPLNPKVLFKALETVLPRSNFQNINSDSHSAGGQFFGTLRALAIGKYTEKKIALIIAVVGQNDGAKSTVSIQAAGEDMEMLPITILELTDEIKKLRETIDTLVDGTVSLMDSAGVSAENQETIIESLRILENKVDTNSLLAKEMLSLINKEMVLIENNQQTLEESLERVLMFVAKMADKLNIEKSLKDRLVGGIKEAIKEKIKGQGANVLWAAAKVALGVLTGIPVP